MNGVKIEINAKIMTDNRSLKSNKKKPKENAKKCAEK